MWARSVVLCRLPSRDRATPFQWSDPYLATWAVVTSRPLCVEMGIVLNRVFIRWVIILISFVFFPAGRDGHCIYMKLVVFRDCLSWRVISRWLGKFVVAGWQIG